MAKASPDICAGGKESLIEYFSIYDIFAPCYVGGLSMKLAICAGALLVLATQANDAHAQPATDQSLLQELQAIEMQQDALKAKRAEIVEQLRQREDELKANLFSIQRQITDLEGGGESERIQRVASSVTLIGPDSEDQTGAASPNTPATNTDDNESGDAKQPNGKKGAEGEKGKTDTDIREEGESVKGWFLGAGLGTRFNLSGDRAQEVTFAELEDGSLIAQITKSEDAEIRVLFESHYMFDNPSVVDPEASFWERVEAFASCGLWSLIVPPEDTDSIGRGCGPFVAVALDKDASPEEFALGHMLSLKRQDAKRPFNLGYGVIIDPDSTTVDRDLFVDGTNQIRSEYVSNVKDGTLSLTTEEETIGFLLLFSTNF